jgi:phosphoesterase RecJ-like protein
MTDIDIAPHRELDEVVDALAAADRVLIATHENPDGDAIGSMAAAAKALRGLGKDVRMYLHADSPRSRGGRSSPSTAATSAGSAPAGRASSSTPSS